MWMGTCLEMTELMNLNLNIVVNVKKIISTGFFCNYEKKAKSVLIENEKENTMKKTEIIAYTRIPDPDCYPRGLAASIHLAIQDEELQVLNNNYGILFAEADITSENNIDPKGIKAPFLTVGPEDIYFLGGIKINEDGTPDENSKGKFVLWSTKDFCSFNHQVLVSLPSEENLIGIDFLYDSISSQFICKYLTWSGGWQQVSASKIEKLQKAIPTKVKGITSLLPVDTLQVIQNSVRVEIPTKLVEKIYDKWIVDADFFENHSDNDKETYRQKFPLMTGYGDPVVFKWKDSWYLTATNDNMEDIGLYIRKADTVEDLFKEGIQESLILNVDVEKGYRQTFWAPEAHVINEELYLFFAISGEVWGPQCHVMKLKDGGLPNVASDWEEPIRFKRQNGDWLSNHGITLDMTYLQTKFGHYVLWSQRYFNPSDSGSMVFIGSVNPENPTILTSDPILLTRPLYGWENMDGTVNNEGPNGFVYNGKVYMTYSGGSSNGYSYAIGLLTALDDVDLLNLDSWHKAPAPILSFYNCGKVSGPGHNSFFTNDKGEIYITYHGELDRNDPIRRAAMHRVYFDKQNQPRFNVML